MKEEKKTIIRLGKEAKVTSTTDIPPTPEPSSLHPQKILSEEDFDKIRKMANEQPSILFLLVRGLIRKLIEKGVLEPEEESKIFLEVLETWMKG